MMKRTLIWLVLIYVFARGSFASLAVPVDRPEILSGVGDDTVKVYREKVMSIAYLPDTLFRDTLRRVYREKTIPIVYLPDSLIRDTLRYEYVRIKNIASRSSFTKELYKLFFVNPKRNRVNVMRTQNSEERFRPYEGKMINKITIKILPPYGTSVYDTTYLEEDLGRLRLIANKIHMKTAVRTLKKQLTLKRGMPLMPFELVQNEILLRNLSYIDDVNIFVSEDPDNPAEVNLTIICKDEFSWGAEVTSNFMNSARVSLVNKNFFRLGHIIDYEFSYRGTKEKKWGNRLEYRINSMFGTHIDFLGSYRNDYRVKQIRGELERPFVTSTVKWGGGFAANRVYYSDELPDIDIERQKIPFDYHSQDVWAGRSFLLRSRHNYTRNLYLMARFLNTNFNDRPEVSSDSNQFYYNRRSYFGGIVYRKLRYYRANLIYDFGRTEDIPTGFLSAITGGQEFNEFKRSGYLGYNLYYSHFNKHTERYYAVEGALASYINESGFERGILKVGLHHISNLISLGNFRLRFYDDVNYVLGIRRYPSDYLYFEDNDVMGFSSDSLRGNQKLSNSLSATLFLPYIKKGFRMSVTAFADVGAIADNNRSILKSKAYWGLGVAVRLRNDNIAFKNITFRFSYYPRVPADMRNIEASMSGNLQQGFYDYQVHKPRTVRYE